VRMAMDRISSFPIDCRRLYNTRTTVRMCDTMFYDNYVDIIKLHSVETSVLYVKGVYRNCNVFVFISGVKRTGKMSTFGY